MAKMTSQSDVFTEAQFWDSFGSKQSQTHSQMLRECSFETKGTQFNVQARMPENLSKVTFMSDTQFLTSEEIDACIEKTQKSGFFKLFSEETDYQ